MKVLFQFLPVSGHLIRLIKKARQTSSWNITRIEGTEKEEMDEMHDLVILTNVLYIQSERREGDWRWI